MKRRPFQTVQAGITCLAKRRKKLSLSYTCSMKVRIFELAKAEYTEAEIIRMNPDDYDEVISSERFEKFDWNDLRMNVEEIYKLVKNETILGLIFFFHETLFNKLEINKLEVSKENVGKDKQYDCIAGCLLAFASLHSLKYLSGEIYVMYKREVKHIYIGKYGFTPYDEYYVKSDRANSVELVSKYLDLPQSDFFR